ncbi:MAG: hypothetical protein KDB33_03770 [Acidimicrobiales bacterium]|nr:hypothetical protein [Acidimicrobiales bacterium]MCB1259504.1 hypothetical protein [Acidimicrobiales bacterium]
MGRVVPGLAGVGAVLLLLGLVLVLTPGPSLPFLFLGAVLLVAAGVVRFVDRDRN